MLLYQIKLALLSLKRNPVISSLLIGAIALGIAVSTAFVTMYSISSSNPIPHKSENLFYVEIDNWDPAEPFDYEFPDRPPYQMTYRDVLGIMGSGIPVAETGMYRTDLVVHPAEGIGNPTRENMRLCFADFFSLFEVPFRYGGPWDPAADDGSSAVVVVDDTTNNRLFGGANSVGKTVRIEDRYFTVVGVLAPWRPTIKYYDPINGAFDRPEAVFLPFGFGRLLEAYSNGNTYVWTPPPEGGLDTFEDYVFQSENLWLQMWVELEDEKQKAAYASYLDAYVLEQQQAGRLMRPLNNQLLTVTQWLKEQDVVPDQTRALLVISLLFLLVCSVNLIGIFLGKFLARAPEVGVRRALGASRASIFLQHVVECEIIGLAGGSIGIVASTAVLAAMNRNRLLEMHDLFRLDPTMVLAAVGLSLLAGLTAGIYPSWRICRTMPATHLKMQ